MSVCLFPRVRVRRELNIICVPCWPGAGRLRTSAVILGWAGPGAGDARPDNLAREVRSYHLQTGDIGDMQGQGQRVTIRAFDLIKQATYVNDLYLKCTFPSVPMIIESQTCSD